MKTLKSPRTPSPALLFPINKPDLVSTGLLTLWVFLGLVFGMVVIRFFSWTAFVAATPLVLLLAAIKGIPQLLSQRQREVGRQKRRSNRME